MALGRCPEYSSPSGDLTACAPACSDPSGVAWGQAAETFVGAALQLCLCLAASLLICTLRDLASWLDLSPASSLHCWQSLPTATRLALRLQLRQYEVTALPSFAATRKEGRKTTRCHPPAKVLAWYSENSQQLQSLNDLMDQPRCVHLSQYQPPKKKG